MPQLRRTGFTIVELLVVVAIIAMLVGILLPAMGRARDSALVNRSAANLRNLATAHGTYSAEWNGRQFTLCKDMLGAYGGQSHLGVVQKFLNAVGTHPPIVLGWGHDDAGDITHWTFPIDLAHLPNGLFIQPVTFTPSPFGSFRIPNARQFNQYVSGRFYDQVFYAPKDAHVLDVVDPLFERADEYVSSEQAGGIFFSSYCLSPAAMYNPRVFRRPSRGGFREPWEFTGGYRSPSFSQVRYPDLKTHMLEHHWLQNNHRDECNPGFESGTYAGCEPFYFNGGVESAPVTLFYDGHIRLLSLDEVREAQLRLIAQNAGTDREADVLFYGDADGDNPAGPPGQATDGYFEDEGFLFASDSQFHADLSFHIFTIDGIKGRDTLPQ